MQLARLLNQWTMRSDHSSQRPGQKYSAALHPNSPAYQSFRSRKAVENSAEETTVSWHKCYSHHDNIMLGSALQQPLSFQTRRLRQCGVATSFSLTPACENEPTAQLDLVSWCSIYGPAGVVATCGQDCPQVHGIS
jgi:hypothetical protein